MYYKNDENDAFFNALNNQELDNYLETLQLYGEDIIKNQTKHIKKENKHARK